MTFTRTSLAFLSLCLSSATFAQTIKVSWDETQGDLKTAPTLQVVVNPPLRPGSPIVKRAYSEVRRLGADYVRYVPWLPYPKLAVAELQAPANGKTSWDFSLIDPMTADFMKATEGHPSITNFSTTPQWMWVTPQPVAYPPDPNQVTWDYTQGTELVDPTAKTLGDYYGRLVSWYVNGGFTDECGKRHESGHHYDIRYWEVLNEVDAEHRMSPQTYTKIYDAIVTGIKAVAPHMKFVGLALAAPSDYPEMFEYFLNPANHAPGIPLDMISYHFYATPTPDQTPNIQQFTFFEQADKFLVSVRYIEAIRKRLSPSTKTTIDEIGAISADDAAQGEPGHVTKPIPQAYWNLAGATYAYVFGNLAQMGVDVAGESQLVGYPTQYPSVSLVDWNTGEGNARFRVLQLLKDTMSSPGKIVHSGGNSSTVYTLAYVTQDGAHKLLLINKRDHDLHLTLPGNAKKVEFVDESTKSAAPQSRELNANTYDLGAYGVAVLTFR